MEPERVSSDRRRGRGRPLLAALSAAVTAYAMLGAPTAALAAGTISVTGATNAFVRPSSTTTLTGLQVGDTDPAESLTVTLSTSQGTVALTTTTGLTLAAGNAWSGAASVTFSGLAADVTAGLGSATLAVGAATGSAAIGLTAYPLDTTHIFSPTNGHFYEYVAAPGVSWTTALAGAAGRSFLGQSGYLASIPSDAVNSLVTSKIPGALNVWIGAESTDAPAGNPARVWHWAAGPLAGQVISNCSNWTAACDFNPAGGYAHWNAGEPNNSGGAAAAHSGEWVAVTNWGAANGNWNDLPDSATVGAAGYVTEYGDGGGTSGFSGIHSVSQSVPIVDVPGAPTAATATPGNGRAAVSFQAPASDGGSSITGYTATASPGGRTGTCAASPCTVVGLSNGIAYSFTVHATNAAGDSAESGASTGVTPYVPPASAPGRLSGTSHDGRAVLTFDEPDTGGLPVSRYELSLDGGGTWTTLQTSGTAPISATVDGLTNGTLYRLLVRAVTNAGLGAAAGPASVTPATVPGAATGVTAALVGTGPDVVVTWDAPADDGGAPITGYTVTAVPGGAQCIATAPTGCTVTGLVPGTYTFTVVASNAADGLADTGSGPAARSNQVGLPTGPGPGPVRALAVKAGDRVLTITFLPPDSDGGSAITGYEVSLNGGVAWAALPAGASGDGLLATLGGVLNDRTYLVTVRARSGRGPGDTAAAVPGRPAGWFADPVPAPQRSVQIPVPKSPQRYHGPLAPTRAAYRSHDGTVAVSARSLGGRQLQPGQAVVLDDSLFAFDSAKLTARGLANLRATATSLRYVRALTCEGYADYGGSRSHESALARARALAVCAALRSLGVRITGRAVGYGSAMPVIVGGKPGDRVANRRVVLRVTG